LISRGVKSDAIGPGQGNSSEVTGPKAKGPGGAATFKQIEMHQPWRPGHSGLTTKFGGGGGCDAQTLAPGHGVLVFGSPIWQDTAS
jgi:hypothetical protein